MRPVPGLPATVFRMDSSVVAIIPARYGSTRLPGKVLASIDGKAMIEHVYTRALQSAGVSRVLVATDDARVREAVRGFGGEVVLTRPDHPSGTDRIAEVAEGLDARVIVNVQCDVPFLAPEMVEVAVGALGGDPAVPMATIRAPIRDDGDLDNPNVVKVVVDRAGCALYFSRQAIPYWRDDRSAGRRAYKHIGLYAYRREFLLRFAQLEPTPLERAERLEQLRALEWGYRIRVGDVETASVEVDTAADLERARRFAGHRAAAEDG